jgi:hypothetical protein
VKLVLQNVRHDRVELKGLKMEPFPITFQETKSSLLLIVEEREDELTGSFLYSQKAFSHGDVELLAAELQELLKIITLQCDQPLSSVAAILDKFTALYHAARKISLQEAFETSLLQRRQPRPMATR